MHKLSDKLNTPCTSGEAALPPGGVIRAIDVTPPIEAGQAGWKYTGQVSSRMYCEDALAKRATKSAISDDNMSCVFQIFFFKQINSCGFFSKKPGGRHRLSAFT